MCSIGSRLTELRHKLVQGQCWDFDPNPASLPLVGMVSRMKDLRKPEFMESHRDLGNEMEALFKVITGRGDPSWPEALITVNLEGKVQLVRLNKIQSMTEEQKKTDECLLNLKAMLDDPNLVKVVENVANVIKFGEHVHHEWVAESFVMLEEWTPELQPGFFPTIKQAYPGKYDKLVEPFRGKGTPCWV